VVGFEHGDWGPVGGGREPGESVRAALERKLAEEAGGRLLSYTPFAVLRCHSRAPAPYRPHEPHPDYDCLYGYGEVELVGPPQLHAGPERTVAVEVLAPDAAVSLLAAKGRAWEADHTGWRPTGARLTSRRVDRPKLRDYWSWLRVGLVVVAVAHRRLGPSSVARPPTTDRAVPSSAVQARCWSQPTTTRLPPLMTNPTSSGPPEATRTGQCSECSSGHKK
jgi:NUDIX domain